MRPDLVNADEIIPLTGLPPGATEEQRRRAEAEKRRAEEELADAEAMIRSLANKHGHTRLPCRTGGYLEICPDPLGHARDYQAMARALKACFDSYNIARPAEPPAGCKTTTTRSRRP